MDTFPDAKSGTVVVGVYINGRLDRIDIPYRASADQIQREIKKHKDTQVLMMNSSYYPRMSTVYYSPRACVGGS
jgi:hypothetical protein